MENKLTYKQCIQTLEKAIDIAIAKGAYRKEEIMQLVVVLDKMNYLVSLMKETAVPFKGVPQNNEENPLPHDH